MGFCEMCVVAQLWVHFTLQGSGSCLCITASSQSVSRSSLPLWVTPPWNISDVVPICLRHFHFG